MSTLATVTQAPTADATAGRSAARVAQYMLRVQTGAAPEFVDLTEAVAECVRTSGVHVGLVTVFCRHTTAGLRLNEHEPLLLQDLADFLTRMAAPSQGYRHDDFSVRRVNMLPDERPNGHAHCQHLFLNSSETIPIADGMLALGRWQRLFLVELDCPKLRDVLVCVLGS